MSFVMLFILPPPPPKKKKIYVIKHKKYAIASFYYLKKSKVERKSTHIQNGVSQSPRVLTLKKCNLGAINVL